jgi:transcriptional regulator with XRE-family HTH domain
VNINVYLGHRLRDERVRKGYSQEYIAEQLGFSSKNSVSMIEQGKRRMTVETLIRYCDTLGMNYVTLLYDASNALEEDRRKQRG